MTKQRKGGRQGRYIVKMKGLSHMERQAMMRAKETFQSRTHSYSLRS